MQKRGHRHKGAAPADLALTQLREWTHDFATFDPQLEQTPRNGLPNFPLCWFCCSFLLSFLPFFLPSYLLPTVSSFLSSFLPSPFFFHSFLSTSLFFFLSFLLASSFLSSSFLCVKPSSRKPMCESTLLICFIKVLHQARWQAPLFPVTREKTVVQLLLGHKFVMNNAHFYCLWGFFKSPGIDS